MERDRYRQIDWQRRRDKERKIEKREREREKKDRERERGSFDRLVVMVIKLVVADIFHKFSV